MPRTCGDDPGWVKVDGFPTKNTPHLRGSCLGGTMFVMANMDITVSDYSMDENDDIR